MTRFTRRDDITISIPPHMPSEMPDLPEYLKWDVLEDWDDNGDHVLRVRILATDDPDPDPILTRTVELDGINSKAHLRQEVIAAATWLKCALDREITLAEWIKEKPWQA